MKTGNQNPTVHTFKAINKEKYKGTQNQIFNIKYRGIPASRDDFLNSSF